MQKNNGGINQDTSYPEVTSLRILGETKKRLDVLGAKNDSYDDIIKRLLDEHEKIKGIT